MVEVLFLATGDSLCAVPGVKVHVFLADHSPWPNTGVGVHQFPHGFYPYAGFLTCGWRWISWLVVHH